MMKLTYKKGFWVLFVLSLLLAIYQYGEKLSLEVDLAFKKISVAFLESDAKVIGEIASRRLYDKNEIESFLNQNYYTSDRVMIKGDTLILDKSYLLFKKDSLISIRID